MLINMLKVLEKMLLLSFIYFCLCLRGSLSRIDYITSKQNILNLADVKGVESSFERDNDYTFSHESERSENKLGNLPNSFRRVARETGKTSKKIKVSVTELSDKDHDQAIIHWSGRNYSVSSSNTVNNGSSRFRGTTANAGVRWRNQGFGKIPNGKLTVEVAVMGVFLLTRTSKSSAIQNSKLWRSTDYGSSFQLVTLKKKSAWAPVVIDSFYASPANRNNLVFTDVKNRVIYWTRDEGNHYDFAPTPFSPDRIIFHPRKDEWILGYCFANNTLHVSFDLGKTWNKTFNFVNPRFFWAELGQDLDESTIHVEVIDPPTGWTYYRSYKAPYSNEDLVTEMGPIAIFSLLVQNEYIFVQKSTSLSSILYVSHNRKAFLKTYFPQNQHPEDLSIVSTNYQQVFIAANHQASLTNLYMSDVTGRFYITSLERVLYLQRTKGGIDTDMSEVAGLPGTYIANQETDNNPRTLISFDQGRRWRLLSPPKYNTKKQLTKCKITNNCSLHLHLQFSYLGYGMPALLSEENAPGIIIAQGMLGKELSLNQTSVFISRDGGVEWQELFQGKYWYNILDHGGAMVAVKRDAQPLDSILYSSTEFITWKRYNLSKKIKVIAVLNEPGISSLVVTVFGRFMEEEKKGTGWVIVKVDFSSILDRPCNNITDYKTWSPGQQYHNNGCLLGQQLTYVRRLPSAECFNGVDYEKNFKVKKCNCTRDDYECNYGYVKSGTTCSPAFWFNPNLPVGECPEKTNFLKNKLYRKIAADNCTGDGLGKLNRTVSVPCPVLTPGGVSLSLPGSHTVQARKEVTFFLNQEEGSKLSTVYVWNFGEDSKNQSVQGYEASRNHSYIFRTEKLHKVTVTATNTNGSTKATLDVMVEEKIVGLFIDMPRGAQARKPVKFQAVHYTDSYTLHGMGQVHYLWTFGTEQKDAKPLLTWEADVTHVYPTAGNYTVTVQAINAVSSDFRLLNVVVYDHVVTVELSFNPVTDAFNKNNPLWSTVFARVLKKRLVSELNVHQSRLDVVVLPKLPTKARVIVLPWQQGLGQNTSIDKVVTRLINKVNNNVIVIGDRMHMFGGHVDIRAVSASIVTDDEHDTNTKHAYFAIYICVPVLFVAAFVIILIVAYYRKQMSRSRQYRMLRQTEEANDGLLNQADDDDIPPLDLDPGRNPGGPDEANYRLSMRQAYDEDDDPLDILLSSEPSDSDQWGSSNRSYVT